MFLARINFGSVVEKRIKRISWCLSFVFALLFAVPWFMILEQSGIRLRMEGAPIVRAVFIFIDVFLASRALFYVNISSRFFQTRQQVIYMAVADVLLIVMISALLVAVAAFAFGIKAYVSHFVIYFVRHLILVLLVVPVVYVLKLMERLEDERSELFALRHHNTEMELAALKSQLDPHFLFNSLTTLNHLVQQNSKDAISFIHHMADTFRYMLESRKRETISVRDELLFLDSYLFLMQKRFEESIRVDIKIGDAHLSRTIPQFALQAVVENALKHNVISRQHQITIELFSEQHSIIVRNNIVCKPAVHGYGIGLDNLAQRYWLLGKAQLKVTRGLEFFTVELPLL
jgi:two-component system LytT family sensor kinase